MVLLYISCNIDDPILKSWKEAANMLTKMCNTFPSSELLPEDRFIMHCGELKIKHIVIFFTKSQFKWNFFLFFPRFAQNRWIFNNN